ncbi:internal scaffolding protein [Apis mellifera associated microvirus 3]|nr:internal scaffolding protein [Apis mellifera associated microvirus 3]
MSKVEIRLPYVQYDDPGLTCPEPTLTQQNFADECDFNNVLKKWEQSGLITHLNPAQPQYGDVFDIADYQEALNTVIKAEAAFAALPAALRDRFQNDPANLLAFVEDSANYEEALRLGLVGPRPSAAERPHESGVADEGQPPQAAT